MTVYYVDTDGSGASAPYATWATASQDLATIIAIPAVAGDTIYCQGALADTAAGSRTLTFPGTVLNPCKLIGVKNGTTNAPPVSSDLCTRAAADYFVISNTSSGALAIDGKYLTASGISFISLNNLTFASTDKIHHLFSNCRMSVTSNSSEIWWNQPNGRVRLYECDIDLSTGTGQTVFARSGPSGGFVWDMIGGVVTCHASQAQIWRDLTFSPTMTGVDLSGSPSGMELSPIVAGGVIRFINCTLGASYNLYSSAPVTNAENKTVLIGTNTLSTVGAGVSYQDYEEWGTYGSIDNSLITRTGGATDGTTANTDGSFSYAMTTNASSTTEGSFALESPRLAAWVTGGVTTATVYIANSSASTDYTQEEVFCYFFTPDTGDTSQHDLTFDAPLIDFVAGTATAVTDDTGSTWDSGANNHQKFSVTVTTGYEGWIYAVVHLAKRQASPDTLYLDPRIIIT